MAWPNVDTARIADALPTVLADKIISQVNRCAPELALIPFKSYAQKSMQWDVEFKNASESTNSAIAEGADVTAYGDDDIVPAILAFCDYSEAIIVTGKAMAVARGSASKGAGVSELTDLWSQKMLRAIRRLAKNLGRDFWQGPGTGNRMLGLYGGSTLTSGAPLSNAGTYAQIVRGTYPEWESNVLANGGVARALSFDLMRAMRKEIYDACGEMPDLIMCDSTQHEKYGALFADQRRYVQEITLRGQKFVLDGGYKALEFDGIPIVMSPNHPSGTLSWLNTNYVKLTALDDGPTEANRSPRMVNLQATPEEQLQSTATPFSARLNPLAVSGDAYPIQMILYPQVQLEKPIACGVLADLVV